MYAAFIDLEKAYDRVDRNALWSVLKIYGVGGQLLKGIQAADLLYLLLSIIRQP